MNSFKIVGILLFPLLCPIKTECDRTVNQIDKYIQFSGREQQTRDGGKQTPKPDAKKEEDQACRIADHCEA